MNPQDPIRPFDRKNFVLFALLILAILGLALYIWKIKKGG